MKFIFVLITSGVLAAAVCAQHVSSQSIFQIEGVWVGTPYATVLQKLGKPQRIKTKKYAGPESCVGDVMTIYGLQYSGLNMVVIRVDAEKPVVFSIAITSSKWPIAGIRIGATEEQVKRKLGEPRIRQEEGKTLYYYDNEPGDDVEFVFTRGRLISISQSELIC